MTKSNKENKRELELYIHIPFCVRKCKYCDFLSAPADEQVQNAYMQALVQEIRAAEDRDCKGQEYIVSSVFIGGGTPSVVEANWIVKLLDTIRDCFVLAEGAEISVELNPGTVTEKSLSLYKQAGVNRISIGCQSALDKELVTIGRIHDYNQFLETYKAVRDSGFANVNVDLMIALPEQVLSDWEKTLHQILALTPQPEHISAYSLIVEEGTPFYDMYERGRLKLPDEEAEREMYWKTIEILGKYGYRQYEISNYAKEGFECRHNCGYWTRQNYLGFGIGAASLFNNKRFKNNDSLQKYLENPLNCRENEECLNLREQMDETIFLGLRMLEGVDTKKFHCSFGVDIYEIYGTQIEEGVKEGLLECRNGKLVLTDRGLDLSNYVMAKFLADD